MRNNRGKGVRFIVGGLVILAAITFLVLRGVRSSAVYYLTVDELRAKGPAIYGQNVRLAGTLDSDSIERDDEGLCYRFTLLGTGEALPVVYTGIVPDTFGLGKGVVVEGVYTPQGVFHAHTLFVQCPSKYEAELEGAK
jgi:cytochrome c-type biogenesis protein CcmE